MKLSRMPVKNAKFWALPKEEKRIAIAKDVIKWLKEDKLVPKAGAFYLILKDQKDRGKLDKILREQEDCQVCALGACFVGMVDLGDKLNFSDVFGSNFIVGTTNNIVDEYQMRRWLEKVFSTSQLIMIEKAFEYKLYGSDSEITFKKEVDFGANYKNDTDRLLAIMKNIIKNRGTFKP